MTLMISIKTLKDRYLIDNNLEDKYIISNIVKAQDFIIQPILGRDKFTEVMVEIESGNLSEDNKYLLDKIEPVIAYYVMSEVVYSTAYKFKNKGLEEGSDSNRFSELVKISKKYLIDSQHYQQLLEGYFERNNDCSSKSSTSVYKTGIFIG